jgi:ornithine--oxo-acid transaminase
VVIEKAEGVWVYDVDGKKYLDCLSSYSAVNQGHVHPEILNALLEQAKKVTLTSRAFRNDQLPLLYKELSDMTGYEMSLPMNSGAEAVETVKLALPGVYGQRCCAIGGIVVAGNYGRTISSFHFH